jgi:glutathione S-transferase
MIILQRPVLRSGVKKISPAAREGIKVLLSTLDSFLCSTEYFAGDELTLADLAILASVGTIKVKFTARVIKVNCLM